MSLAFNYPGAIFPWSPETKPWGAAAWHRRFAALAVLNVVTPIAQFRTDAFGIFFAKAVVGDNWSGSASGTLIVRARGGSLLDPQQWTHDLESGVCVWTPRIYFPPFSDCEISMLSFTSTGNDRNLSLFTSGWYVREGERT